MSGGGALRAATHLLGIKKLALQTNLTFATLDIRRLNLNASNYSIIRIILCYLNKHDSNNRW